MLKYYILNKQGQPVPEPNNNKWAKWYSTTNRQVADNTLITCRVSTVFLGIDHGHTIEGTPILWETMIFDGPYDGYQMRYTSKEEALRGHTTAVKIALGHEQPPQQERS